jgi:hypothetical protein
MWRYCSVQANDTSLCIESLVSPPRSLVQKSVPIFYMIDDNLCRLIAGEVTAKDLNEISFRV